MGFYYLRFFSEFFPKCHFRVWFQSNAERFRFFRDLKLSVPIDIIKFSPGGSVLTTFCIVKVNENRSTSEMLTQGATSLQKLQPYLKEFHTRAQKREFRSQLNNVAKVLPAVADMIYKHFSLDATTAAHPVTQERIRLVFLGHEDLLVDLRSMNPGRPAIKFNLFFEKLSEVVEEVTAADERRHNIAHLSQWISLKELINKASERCPEDTPIPSKSLVRLQFAPRNPYSHAALTFTSKIKVQYKIQTRQLRSSHPDEHYCAAQYKYFRTKAVEMKSKCALYFCDDKAKVPVGSPGHPVSTGVRGKKTIAPSATALSALDHDMTNCSLTPSVFLKGEIPDTIENSFVRGQVTTVINDSVFQTSQPFRHAATLLKLLEGKDFKVLMKYTDGGTDQRNTLESVKCASICLFLELNLDMLILCRCAPGQSWLNPAERVMSILNLGLQNCALEREKGDEHMENYIKKCNSMASMRKLAETNPVFKEKWQHLINPLQNLLSERFNHLALKDKPFKSLTPVSDDSIDTLKSHLREKFPSLNVEKLQKIHTNKCVDYQN